MAQGDLVSLSVRGQVFLNDAVNVFGFVQKSVTAGFIGQTLIDEWQAAAQASYLSLMAPAYTMQTLTARAVHPDTHEIAQEQLPGGTVGTGTGDPEANQVAAIITWRTALAGRSFRGRSYIPAVPEGRITSGLLEPNHITALNGFISNMLTNFGPSGLSTVWQLVIISRFNNGVERPTPVGTPVTVGVPRTVPGVQRRRRIGVGS